MSKVSQQILHIFQSRTKNKTSRIRLAVLWIVLLFLGFWVTAIDVENTSPPSALTADPTFQVGLSSPSAAPAFSENDPSASPSVSPQPARIERYANIEISEEELTDLAAIVYLEAGNQSIQGQQAVAEVILNRVIAPNFPDTVHDVLFQGVDSSTPQFSTAPFITRADPTESQYHAIDLALYGPSILPTNVVYFSQGGENEYVWGSIEGHIFCYQYPWASK